MANTKKIRIIVDAAAPIPTRPRIAAVVVPPGIVAQPICIAPQGHHRYQHAGIVPDQGRSVTDTPDDPIDTPARTNPTGRRH